jgi:drug/metabolite transporter (DMT)-like permease
MYQSLLLIFSGMLIAIPSVINKHISRSQLHGATYTFGYAGLQTILCLPLLFVEPRLPTNITYWLLFIFSAVVYGLSLLLVFESYKKIDVSVVAVIQRFNMVIITLIALVLLNEKPSILRLGGLLLIFFSSVLITLKKGRIKLNLGLWFAFGSTFFSALAAIIDKKLLDEISAFSYAPLNGLAISVLFATSKKARAEIPQLYKQNGKGIFISALFGSLSWVLYLYVLKNNDISAAYPVYKSISLIASVILGILFLRETKDLGKKFAATLFGVIGVILTSMSF